MFCWLEWLRMAYMAEQYCEKEGRDARENGDIDQE